MMSYHNNKLRMVGLDSGNDTQSATGNSHHMAPQRGGTPAQTFTDPDMMFDMSPFSEQAAEEHTHMSRSQQGAHGFAQADALFWNSQTFPKVNDYQGGQYSSTVGVHVGNFGQGNMYDAHQPTMHTNNGFDYLNSGTDHTNITTAMPNFGNDQAPMLSGQGPYNMPLSNNAGNHMSMGQNVTDQLIDSSEKIFPGEFNEEDSSYVTYITQPITDDTEPFSSFAGQDDIANNQAEDDESDVEDDQADVKEDCEVQQEMADGRFSVSHSPCEESEFEESDGDARRSAKVPTMNKSGHLRKPRRPRAKLLKWDDNDWKNVVLGIIWACGEMGLQIPFDQASQLASPNCTGGALQQAVLKLRAKQIAAGYQIPPLKMTWTRKNRYAEPTKSEANAQSPQDNISGRTAVAKKKQTRVAGSQSRIVKLGRAYDDNDRVHLGYPYLSRPRPKRPMPASFTSGSNSAQGFSGQGSSSTRMSESNGSPSAAKKLHSKGAINKTEDSGLTLMPELGTAARSGRASRSGRNAASQRAPPSTLFNASTQYPTSENGLPRASGNPYNSFLSGVGARVNLFNLWNAQHNLGGNHHNFSAAMPTPQQTPLHRSLYTPGTPPNSDAAGEGVAANLNRIGNQNSNFEYSGGQLDLGYNNNYESGTNFTHSRKLSDPFI